METPKSAYADIRVMPASSEYLLVKSVRSSYRVGIILRVCRPPGFLDPEEDWDRLAGACRTIADESFAAHKRALDDAAGGQHPASGGWTPANLRWLLARTGPVSSAQFGELLGCTRSAVQQRGGFTDAVKDMFPSHDVLIAYRLLF